MKNKKRLPKVSPEAVEISGLFSKLMPLLHRALMDNTRKIDTTLTGQQVRLIGTLAEANRPLKMSELSKQMRISQGTLTENVKRLIKRDLVERRRDLKDDRVVFLCLSKKGQKETKEVKKVMINFFSLLCQGMSQQDKTKFVECYRFITKVIHEFSEKSDK